MPVCGVRLSLCVNDFYLERCLTKGEKCVIMLLAVNNFYKKGECLYLKDDMLGKKIKTLRLERKMTQAELAGETITRNMLSQIENGVAQPSVSTIIDLAKKLDTPIEYFFSENGDLDDFKKLGAIAKIKKYYAAGDFAKCISRLDALGVSDDETEYIYAKAYFARGVESYRKGMLRSAVAFLEASLSHGERSVYVDDDLGTMTRQYLHMIEYISTKDTPLVSEEPFSKRCERHREDILYIHAIADNTRDICFFGEDSLYKAHLSLRKSFDFSDTARMAEAVEALKALLTKCASDELAVLRYYIYCDLEKLASGCGDYKCAYECSSGRLLLAETMNH